jgi:hypothetical protein
MAGRPECVHCGHRFTPHPRNRSRTENRQRVCGDCGPVIGHRQADKRYRTGPGARRRKRRNYRAAHSTAGPALAPETTAGLSAGVELVGHVGEHLAAIAALVGRACVVSPAQTRQAALHGHQREI